MEMGWLPANYCGDTAMVMMGGEELNAAVAVLAVLPIHTTRHTSRRSRFVSRMAGSGARAGISPSGTGMASRGCRWISLALRRI